MILRDKIGNETKIQKSNDKRQKKPFYWETNEAMRLRDKRSSQAKGQMKQSDKRKKCNETKR